MNDRPKKPIVLSAHLAEGGSPALSELEFSLTLAASAFQKWIVRCAAAAGAQLTPLEVQILHAVRHRDRPKRFMDVILVLHIEDAHLANYAIKKLQAAGLVATERSGKEKMIRVTEEGIAFCDAYKEVRERLLVESLIEAGGMEEELSNAARQLRFISGHYSQAARSAATL